MHHAHWKKSNMGAPASLMFFKRVPVPHMVSEQRSLGDSYIVLKDVRLRCTLSPQDSANLPARKPGAQLIWGVFCEGT